MIDDARNALRVVCAYQGEQCVIAKAESPADAWREALAMATKIAGQLGAD